MNYRRIEIIFLMVFLLINAYLISVLYKANKDREIVHSREDNNIVQVLKEENIKYDKKLSNKHAKGTYISGEITSLLDGSTNLVNQKVTDNQGMLVSTLQNPMVFSKQDEIASLNKFKNNSHNVQYGEDYQYLKEASSSNKVVCYAQKYDNLPIFDESAEIVFIKENSKSNKEKILGYKQKHIVNIQEMRDKQVLISQKDALITLFNNNKLDRGMTIEWITLGYSKIYNEDKTNIYVPTWFVSLKTSNDVQQLEKVNAITNKIMSGSTTDLVN